jgi:hypothetical protein
MLLLRSFADTCSRCCLADRKHREGLICPDSLVVAGTKRESVDSGEWHHETTSSMILLSYARRPDSIRRNPRLVRCIFHCVSAPFFSLSFMFVTSVCITCLCVYHANLTCIAIRCDPTRMRRREFGVSKKYCGGSPPTPCFSHHLNHGHFQ